MSIGVCVLLFDANGSPSARLQGDWKGWHFRFTDSQGQELGVMTKTWSGLRKELLTSADTYVISLNDRVTAGSDQAALLFMAGLAVDILFKER